MKILLISSNIAVSPYPVYPLGLSMIAASLADAGHEIRQFDFLHHGNSLDALENEIESFKPELFGISIRNIDNVNLLNEKHYIGIVKDIVKKIREISTCKVILGGCGFSLIPELVLQETGADYGVVGEGESLMVGFSNDAAMGIYPEERLLGTTARMSGEDIPSAKYDEQLMEYYLHNGNIVSIQTKRGCPHKCVYCSYPVLEGADIRKRDASSIVDDIELLRDSYKTKYIFFVDSVFNDDEGAFHDVLNEMLRRNINIPWTGFFKPTGLNDEIVEKMKKTGLASVEIGADAASDITLEKMGKCFIFQDIAECNNLFNKHGVAVSNFFMFGGPGETRETVMEGIDNIKGLIRCVNFIFMGIRILPKTPLAQIALKEGIISSDKEMLKTVFYISPAIDKDWLEKTLTSAFADTRHCIFPPDALDDSLRVLHKMGYAGTMWNMLIPQKKIRRRRKRVAE